MINQQLEDELRTAFTRFGDGLEVSEETRRRLTGQRYHPGRPSPGRLAAVGGAVGLAAAATALALLPSTSQPVSPRATVTLDAFKFQLPAGYVPKPRPVCKFIYILPAPEQPGSVAIRHLSRHAERPYVTAAAADGGCIALNISSPFTPKPGKPDPNAPSGSKPVRVGHHHGFANGPDGYYAYVRTNEHPGRSDRPTWVRVRTLDVQIKAAHGRERDIIFLTTKLPLRTVIKIAVSGLG